MFEGLSFDEGRRRMVERDLRGRDITDEAVLSVMGRIERHRFVPPVDADEAYDDTPLGIACGQTISQPYIVAYMTERLGVQAGMRVLEIGTGCGYQTAVLAGLGAEVFTVERHAALSESARALLAELDLDGEISCRVGDGTLGWPEHAPYDRILVTAAGPEVPPALIDQLAVGGRMVIPVGRGVQVLMVVERTPEGVSQRADLPVRFVPLIGEQGA